MKKYKFGLNFQQILLVIAVVFVLGIIIFSFFHWDAPNFKDSYLPILIVMLGVLPTILTAQVGEWNKLEYEKKKRDEDRKSSLYQRREEVYNNLIDSITSFNTLSQDSQKQKLFLNTYQKAWLYCPDEIVRSIGEFMDAISVANGSAVNHEKGIEMIQKIHLLIRKDLISLEEISETGLEWKDFKNLGVRVK